MATLLGSFILPPALLFVIYQLLPEWLLTGSYLDSSSLDQTSYAADAVFSAELYAIAASLTVALVLGSVWALTFGRRRPCDDRDAASKKPQWWALCALAVLAVPGWFWWYTSGAALPQNSFAFAPLALFFLLAAVTSAAIFWLVSQILATPQMLPSIPAGVGGYRRWVIHPENERRKSR